MPGKCLSLRWPTHSSSLSASVNQFWTDGSFTDVTLAVPGTAVSAHRAVLAARSAGLRRLLLAAGPEEPAPLLFLRGVTADQLHLLLQLLYTGSVVAGRRQLSELIELCRDLEIDGLEENVVTPVEDEGQGATTECFQADDAEHKAKTEALSVDVCKPHTGLHTVTDAQSLSGVGEKPGPVEMPHPLPGDSQVSDGQISSGLDSAVDASCCEAVLAQAPDDAMPLTKHSTYSDGPGISARPCSLDDSETRGSSGLRQLATLLDSLGPGERLQLKRVAERVLFPDLTSCLPDEILVDILSWLSPRDLLSAAGVCRRWRAVTADDSVWRPCCRRMGVDPAGQAASPRQMCLRRFAWTEQPMSPPKILNYKKSITRIAVQGDRIITGGYDGIARVWSASRGVREQFMEVESRITCMEVAGDLIVLGCRDGSLSVWSALTGRCLRRLRGHTSSVLSMAISGTRAASCSDGGTVRLWDLESGSKLAVLRGNGSAVWAVCFDGLRVVWGDCSGCVHVWSSGTRSDEDVWETPDGLVTSLQHDSGVVVSGHMNSIINVWDMTTRQLRFKLDHDSADDITDICLKEDRLLSGHLSGAVRLWDLRSGSCLRRLAGNRGHGKHVTGVRLLADMAVTSSWYGSVKLWGCQSGAMLRDLVTPELSHGCVYHLWVSPSRLVCSVGDMDGFGAREVLVFDMTPRGAPEGGT